MKTLTIKIIAILMFIPAMMWAQDGRVFYIQSAQEYGRSQKGFWDLPGSGMEKNSRINKIHNRFKKKRRSFKRGANVQAWQLDNGADRKFKFIYVGSWGGHKYYNIQPLINHKARVDVAGNNHRNGGNIHIWENNNGEAQRFRLKNMGNGRWRIISAKGYHICLSNRKSRNGSSIVLWDDHPGAWMNWMLIDVNNNKPFGKKHATVKKPRRPNKPNNGRRTSL